MITREYIEKCYGEILTKEEIDSVMIKLSAYANKSK